jgi:hypothetical protein
MDYKVDALAVLPSGAIVAGGGFTIAGGTVATNIARWDGSAWHALGSGTNGSVNAIAVLPNGDIAVGGVFTAASGIVNRIARWNGATWLPFSTGMESEVNDLAVLPSGELVAAGSFTAAGGLTSGYWARWSETGIPWIARHPTAQSARVADIVTLTAASAEGYDFDGPVSYRWFHDGVEVVDGPGGASPGGGTVHGSVGTISATGSLPTLTISGVAPSDAGQYSAVFTNDCGSALSDSAALVVVTACIADLNGDLAVDAIDLGQLLGQWGICSGCAADFNLDGQVNGLDMGTLLGEWGLGCP